MSGLIARGTPSRRDLLGLGAALCLASPAGASGEVLRVGPGRPVRSLAQAARLAREGMRIEVEAGDYLADVASWNSNDLSLTAVGGRVRLIANGAHTQGKGIFVIGGQGVSVEGFDFIGATSPEGNGAGIRFERGSLRVRDCRFSECEMGLLSNNDPAAELVVERCEFSHARPRAGDRPAHLLYAGAIARLTVSGSYFHHGRIGHLLKSRAAVNHILYNRLSDEAEGRASYELEFPNGGRAVVIGNVIQQGPRTENAHLISFGAEGYKPRDNQLWLVHNTLIDQRPQGGIYLRTAAGAARVQLVNNLLVGGGRLEPAPDWVLRHNPEVGAQALGDWALKPDSRWRGSAVDPGPGPEGQPLRPTRQYRHPHDSVALSGPARDPGALQQAP
jgi:hypothetical protein